VVCSFAFLGSSNIVSRLAQAFFGKRSSKKGCIRNCNVPMMLRESDVADKASLDLAGKYFRIAGQFWDEMISRHGSQTTFAAIAYLLFTWSADLVLRVCKCRSHLHGDRLHGFPYQAWASGRIDEALALYSKIVPFILTQDVAPEVLVNVALGYIETGNQNNDAS